MYMYLNSQDRSTVFLSPVIKNILLLYNSIARNLH